MDIREENFYYNRLGLDKNSEITINHDRNFSDYLKSYLFFLIRIFTLIFIIYIYNFYYNYSIFNVLNFF